MVENLANAVKGRPEDAKAPLKRIKNRFSEMKIREVYDFDTMLGTGSFGDVRVGRLKRSPEETVAIKSIFKRKLLDEDLRFLEEELLVM